MRLSTDSSIVAVHGALSRPSGKRSVIAVSQLTGEPIQHKRWIEFGPARRDLHWRGFSGANCLRHGNPGSSRTARYPDPPGLVCAASGALPAKSQGLRPVAPRAATAIQPCTAPRSSARGCQKSIALAAAEYCRRQPPCPVRDENQQGIAAGRLLERFEAGCWRHSSVIVLAGSMTATLPVPLVAGEAAGRPRGP